MLKALLWKEWHEQRWRVALATTWLLGMTAIGLKTRILPDEVILVIIWVPTAFILPVFLGMGLFASERRNGTMPYLMVHPVSRTQILAAKTITGALAYWLTLTISGIMIWLAVGGRELSSAGLAGRLATIAAFGAILFAWQFLAGLRCRREETYVLVSGIILGCWALHAVVVEEWKLVERLGYWTWAVSPLAIGGADPAKPSEIWTVAVVQSLILVGLAFGPWLRFRGLREGKS